MSGVGADFPLARIAVAIAVVSMVAPSLSRPFRRAVLPSSGWPRWRPCSRARPSRWRCWPASPSGGGWRPRSAWCVESPTGLPAPSEVVDAAAELGVELSQRRADPPAGVGRGPVHRRRSTAEPVEVSVYGRDAADAQLLAKVWRFLWYRDSGPTLLLTRLQQVEHEAYLTLAARHAGVRAPDVLVAASAPSGDEALLVTVAPPGSGARRRRRRAADPDRAGRHLRAAAAPAGGRHRPR